MTDRSAEAIGRLGSSTCTTEGGSAPSRIAVAAKMGTDGSSPIQLTTYTEPGCASHTERTASRHTFSRSVSYKGAKCQGCGLTKASYNMYCSSTLRRPLLGLTASFSSSEENDSSLEVMVRRQLSEEYVHSFELGTRNRLRTCDSFGFWGGANKVRNPRTSPHRATRRRGGITSAPDVLHW